MTLDYNLAEAKKSETCSIPSELEQDLNEDPETSLLHWQFEGNIVKTELIIPSDNETLAPRMCRLCCVEHTAWFPFYKSDGNLGLEMKHLEMIRILASIHITHTQDHSSVICTFCLMKIEEFAILRDIWRRNDKSALPCPEPAQQAITGECKEAECEQSHVQENPNEESIVINDDSEDSDVQIVSSSSSFVPEESSKRETRSDKLKSSLIQQAMRIVHKQFNKTKTSKPAQQAITGECKEAECEQSNVQEKPNEESIIINDDSGDSDVQKVSSSSSFVPDEIGKSDEKRQTKIIPYPASNADSRSTI